MANTVVTQILADGGKYTDLKVDMNIDTSNLAYQVFLNPAVQYIDPVGNPTTQYRIDQIDFAIQDGVAIDLFWDATVPVSIVRLVGRGRWPAVDYHQPLQNNSGSGKTGSIGLSSTGWTAGVIVGSFMMKC